VVTYFHIYWIPLFPMKRGLKFVECQYCQAKFQQTLDELRARSAQAEQEKVAEAAAHQAAAQQRQDDLGQLRQRWSEAPEDRVSLVRLLGLKGDAAVFGASYLRPIFALLAFQVIEQAGIACLIGRATRALGCSSAAAWPWSTCRWPGGCST